MKCKTCGNDTSFAFDAKKPEFLCRECGSTSIDEETKTPLGLVLQFDQMGAVMQDYAQVIAAYYAALIENKMPPELAQKLTMEWHQIYWMSLSINNMTHNDQ